MIKGFRRPFSIPCKDPSKNINFGKHWINNGKREVLIDLEFEYMEDYQEYLKTGEYRLGRLPNHRPPKKVKGCKRFRAPKTFTYRKPDGTRFQVDEETFHANKHEYKSLGYVLCRKSPYAILDDPDANLTPEEREELTRKREEFHRNKVETGKEFRWMTDLRKVYRVKHYALKAYLSNVNTKFAAGRWIINPDPDSKHGWITAFTRRKRNAEGILV